MAVPGDGHATRNSRVSTRRSRQPRQRCGRSSIDLASAASTWWPTIVGRTGSHPGDACTYGFYEKQDLHAVIDTIGPGPIVLVGTSLGAAVALQEAASDPRVSAIVAAETFSDLRTVATERAPFFFTPGVIDRAFRLAEQQARFRVDEVSAAKAAAHIKIPVLLVHGAADVDTPPAHSQRVFAALAGPKRLILVSGAAHNGSLRGDVWEAIEGWLGEVLPPPFQ